MILIYDNNDLIEIFDTAIDFKNFINRELELLEESPAKKFFSFDSLTFRGKLQRYKEITEYDLRITNENGKEF